MKITLTVGLFSLFAPALAGQTPPAPTPAPPACATAEYRQFDFWVGDWEVFDPQGNRAGENRIEKILKGCVLLESWKGTGMSGHSYNIYDATTKRWHQSWVDDRGTLLQLDGGFADGKMVLSGERIPRQSTTGAKVTDRISWSRLGPDRVRQHWERSADAGKTWSTLFDGTYVRKSRRGGPRGRPSNKKPRSCGAFFQLRLTFFTR